ncbi:MAG: VWA domain-containing protein [Acidobacteria bacterium]|nr:VWA domain-containing protein [Acidobacteriota bacterium]
MHLLNRRQALLAAAGTLVPGAFAQDPVFRSDTRLVVLHATVLDKDGHLVTTLGREAFTILENGQPQQLRLFRREDVPVSMGLVIDNSGSMRNKRTQVGQAALALVKASNPQDEMFIVNFNDDAFLDVTFTNEVKKLEEGLTRIDSRGGTAMRDAVTMSMDYLKEKAKRDKKVLLVVSDGDDTGSSPNNTIEKLITKAQQMEVLIYTIGLLNEEDKRAAKRAERALKGLTVASGGLSYFPKEVTAVDEIATQVAHEIRNQYILAYSPSEQALDGTFRQIKVQVKGPGRPVARTRSGYYATKDQAAPAGVAPSGVPGTSSLITPPKV